MEGRQSKIGSDYITCARRLTSHIWHFARGSQELLQRGRQREASIEDAIDRYTQKIQYTTDRGFWFSVGGMKRCTTSVRSRLVSIILPVWSPEEKTASPMSLD